MGLFCLRSSLVTRRILLLLTLVPLSKQMQLIFQLESLFWIIVNMCAPFLYEFPRVKSFSLDTMYFRFYEIIVILFNYTSYRFLTIFYFSENTLTYIAPL